MRGMMYETELIASCSTVTPQRERAIAARTSSVRCPRVRRSTGVPCSPSIGMQEKNAATRATAQAKISPSPVRTEARSSRATKASFKMELIAPCQSCAAPWCNPSAASSSVSAAIVATEPMTNS